LAIGSRKRAGAVKLCVGPADHEGQRAAGRGGDPAGDGRVEEVEAPGLHRLADLAGGCDVDRRAIDEQGAGRGVGGNVILEHSANVLCGRQHGDEDLGTLHCFGGRSCRRAPAFAGMLDGFRHEIERVNFMPRLGEVRRHSAAHMAEPDECDARHD